MLSLTPSELYVAALMVRDYPTSDIALQMGISDIAVRQHVIHIKDKTGIRTHAGLGAYLATNQVKTKTNKGESCIICLQSVGLRASV
jgi:DNA-binding CsgD family transcriptional regulator